MKLEDVPKPTCSKCGVLEWKFVFSFEEGRFRRMSAVEPTIHEPTGDAFLYYDELDEDVDCWNGRFYHTNDKDEECEGNITIPEGL